MNSKCFTFYSYKGGSGRSTTLLNTAKHLAEKLNASKENPILLVDADLESAGLTYFFDCEKKFTGRFNCTIHSEVFLNRPREVLTGVIGDNTFGKSRERLISCEKIAERVAALYPKYSVSQLFEGVLIRETTAQILEKIIGIAEKGNLCLSEIVLDEDEKYIYDTYDLTSMISRLGSIEKEGGDNLPERKRALIEEFLPSDGMVDVSKYFGFPEKSVMFIGVDIAFTGVHSGFLNDRAQANQRCIVRECGRNGFSAILFDCGAGVQSTAHVLNHVSDVVVYCMRPTYQFVSGTRTQLLNYHDCLNETVKRKKAKAEAEGKTCEKKSVILLPTAVPYENGDTCELQNDSFGRIERIAKNWKSFVDDSFCTYETALKEVALFKWREHILGTKVVNENNTSPETIKKLEVYSDYKIMPADAKKAYETYHMLAERLIYNA